MVIVRVDTRNGSEMYFTGDRFSRKLLSAYRFSSSEAAQRRLDDFLTRRGGKHFGYRILPL